MAVPFHLNSLPSFEWGTFRQTFSVDILSTHVNRYNSRVDLSIGNLNFFLELGSYAEKYDVCILKKDGGLFIHVSPHFLLIKPSWTIENKEAMDLVNLALQGFPVEFKDVGPYLQLYSKKDGSLIYGKALVKQSLFSRG